MSDMVKYKGSEIQKWPKRGPVFHHVWHSPLHYNELVTSLIQIGNKWQSSFTRATSAVVEQGQSPLIEFGSEDNCPIFNLIHQKY